MAGRRTGPSPTGGGSRAASPPGNAGWPGGCSVPRMAAHDRVLLIGDRVWLDEAELACQRVGRPVERLGSGARGLLRLLQEEPAGVIADLDCAGIGGRDLAMAARLSPGTARVPVFLLAGPGRGAEARRARRESGADGWFPTSLPATDGLRLLFRTGPSPATPPVWPPTAQAEHGLLARRIGPWQLGTRLGRGGFATVFAATDGERQVALKLLHPEVLRDPTDLVRFLREVAALHVVRVPEVVRLLDWGWANDGQPYLALERLLGSSLGDHVEDHGPIDAARGERILRDMARALEATSRLGLVHRDVTPWNVWLRPDGGATLIDFGLAKGSGMGNVTVGDQLVGTAAYIAPELLRPRTQANLASDLYALGATLHRALAGRDMHAESSVRALLERVARGTPPDLPLGELRPDLPASLVEMVERLTSFEPVLRLTAFESLMGLGRCAA